MAVQSDIGVGDGRHFLGGYGGIGVGEHSCESGNVLVFGGEAGADDVVGGGHAFDDVCESLACLVRRKR